jgi:hypothetical protein
MWELLVVFALGYFIGGISALVLIALTLASRSGSTGRHWPKATDNH